MGVSAVPLTFFEQSGSASVVRHGYESPVTGHHPPADEPWKIIARAEPFIAVVTDVQMPVMDGSALLARLRAQRPSLPVIVVTSEHLTGDEPHFSGALRVLRKPVAVEALLAAVAEAQSLAKASRRRSSLWGSLRAICGSPAHAVMLTLAVVSSFALANLWLSRTR